MDTFFGNDVLDTNGMSLNDLHEIGIVPHIKTPKRVMEDTYNELKPDGTLCAAESKVTWDKYDFEIHIKLPIEMSDQKVLEVFQDILDRVVKQMRDESSGLGVIVY